MIGAYFHKHPLIGVFLLAVFLRLPSWFIPYYNVDEITNGLFANFILDHKLELADFLGNAYFLTHYLYTAVFYLFGKFNLTALHVVHSLWVGGTALAVYGAAKACHDDHKVGVWAGMLYAVFSTAFFSKDFHAALAESFSLLPAALAALFYFKATREDKLAYYALAGVFAAGAVLFKFTTAGIVVGMTVGVLFLRPRTLKPALILGLFFVLGFGAPVLFYRDPIAGIELVIAKIVRTNASYVQFYQSLSTGYFLLKYSFRTLLVAAGLLGLCVPAAIAVARGVKQYRNCFSDERARFIALLVWIACNWLLVALGKRVFFHYFVSLLVPLAILAAPAAESCRVWVMQTLRAPQRMRRICAYVVVGMVMGSVGVFYLDAWVRFSLSQPKIRETVDYIRSHTQENEAIFVWGFSPHIYFEAGRQPASTFFWSDSLAGTSPGSAAMEYAAVEGKPLNALDGFVRDLKGVEPVPGKESRVVSADLQWLGERELLDFMDLLAAEPNPKWQKVFRDFFIQPPVLIVDTSAKDYRGFKQFPLMKYELLKRFVENHYHYVTTIDHSVIYRLKGM